MRRIAESRDVLVSDASGTHIINIDKHTKQIGKASRRDNVAEFLGLARPLPLLVSNRLNDVLPVVIVSVVDNLVPLFPCPIRAQEEEAFYRPL